MAFLYFTNKFAIIDVTSQKVLAKVTAQGVGIGVFEKLLIDPFIIYNKNDNQSTGWFSVFF